MYTFLPLADIGTLMHKHWENPGAREAQETLARLVTETVHGASKTVTAVAATDVLFSGRPLAGVSREERAVLMAEVPHVLVGQGGIAVVDALVAGGVASSKGDARRLVESKAVSLNNRPVETVDAKISVNDFENGLALLGKGKRETVLLVLK